MTKIIGHRGAAGLALENSEESLRLALRHKLDAIEIDIHMTADHHIVVLHDRHTKRIANEKVLVRQQTLAELQSLELKNGQRILTLDEVLTLLDGTSVILDIKGEGIADYIDAVLRRHPRCRISFASFKHGELRAIRQLYPDAPTYVLDHFKPVEIIHNARRLHATGIGLNMWLMNPFTYRLAQRYSLEMYVYTINSPFIGRFFRKLYPKVHICTDHPERFVAMRG